MCPSWLGGSRERGLGIRTALVAEMAHSPNPDSWRGWSEHQRTALEAPAGGTEPER